MVALKMIRWAKIDNFTLVQTGSNRIQHDLKFSTSKIMLIVKLTAHNNDKLVLFFIYYRFYRITKFWIPLSFEAGDIRE